MAMNIRHSGDNLFGDVPELHRLKRRRSVTDEMRDCLIYRCCHIRINIAFQCQIA